MMKLALVFVAALALGVDGQTPSYSALCSTHTMVIYPTEPGSACASPPGPFSSGVSAAEITTIVNAHNTLRRKVATGGETLGAPGPQPQAANMRQMSWDAELAKVAQRWASQCLSGHDACRKVSRFGVGQNIYSSFSSSAGGSAPWTSAVNAWYNEVKDFNKNNINPFVSVTTPGAPVTGHYTQVAWANSYLVGCGYAYYKSTSATYAKYPYTKVMVCNYGPAGNVVGAGTAMYKIGTPCSQCPVGTVCSSSLCV